MVGQREWNRRLGNFFLREQADIEKVSFDFLMWVENVVINRRKPAVSQNEKTRQAEEYVEFRQEHGTPRSRISGKRKANADIFMWPE